MSEDVYKKGTLKKIKYENINTVEQMADAILIEKGTVYDNQSYETRLEHLQDMFYQKYFSDGINLYSVDVESDGDHGDIFEAHKNEDGTIGFVLKYYNGGCSMDEALEMAFKKLKSS